MVIYGMYITTKVSDHRYDIGVKCQGHIYLKPSTVCNANSNMYIFLTKGVHIMHNDRLWYWCVDYKGQEMIEKFA